MPASLIYNTAAVAYNGYIYSIGGEDNGVGVNTSSVLCSDKRFKHRHVV